MNKLYIFSLLLLANFIFTSCNTENISYDVIIPQPNSVVAEQGVLTIGNSVNIISEDADKVAKYLKNEVETNFNITTDGGKKIRLVVDETLDTPEEGYSLKVEGRGVTISGSNSKGIFNGVQSLLQLMRAGQVEDKIKIQRMVINDAPRFGWRAYMLDESRHFFGEENAYRILDAMAELKLNVLHWHLTDDAGWRIEIKKYPLLTEIGSKRKDTEVGTWGSGKLAGVPHEGYYTQEQIKNIVAYAKERNIKVIPEIEMPGHASASIAAYPWLGTKNEKIEVPVKFGKHFSIYNVIDPKVQQFLKDVIVEVIDLFDTDIIHIGGDEVRFDQWEDDSNMRAHLKKNNFTSFMDIQIEFTNNMSRFIEEQGCSMMGWNEILGKNLHEGEISFSETSTKIAPNVIVHFWKGDIKELTNAAKQGYKLVNSYHLSTYLDYSHKTIPLTNAYEFDPIPADLPSEHHDNIVGFGSQMWTEWVPNVEKLNQQTFPRLAAYSEVGWTNKENKNFENFVVRLKPMVEKWKTVDGIIGFDAPELE